MSVETTADPACRTHPPGGDRQAGRGHGAAAGRVLRGAVHGDPRPQHRQRRAALDPVEPRLHLARTAVDRRRLRDHVRGLLDARRPRRRPLRAAPDVRDGAARVRARLAGRRRRVRPRDARARARGAGHRRRADGGLLAGDHHLLVRPRPAAAPRDRRVGGDERARRRRGDAVRGDHHAGAVAGAGCC